MEILNELISTYKDYPKEGIDFKDVLEVTQHPIAFKELILKMSVAYWKHFQAEMA